VRRLVAAFEFSRSEPTFDLTSVEVASEIEYGVQNAKAVTSRRSPKKAPIADLWSVCYFGAILLG
jgi:hypothetical protein